MICRKCGQEQHLSQMCPMYQGEDKDTVCISCCEACEYHRHLEIYRFKCLYWDMHPVKKAEYELKEARRREREAADRLDYCYAHSSDPAIIKASRNFRFFTKERDLAARRLVALRREEELL